MTHLIDLGLTQLNFGPLTFIEGASKGPSFCSNLLLTFRSDTFEVECLLTGCAKHPFHTVNTVCKYSVTISQKLVFQANLILGLFITYEALPTKAITSIGMVIGVQFNWFTCHSKTIIKRVNVQAMGHQSFDSLISQCLQGVWGNLSHTIQFR